MILIGIDYGLAKVGIALAISKLAEPLLVIRYKTQEELINKLKEILVSEDPDEIVIGISEGKTATETKSFIEELKKQIDIPIQEFDETLSTYDAQRLGREAHMKRKKRRKMEDAMAAAVMLQNYIDVN